MGSFPQDGENYPYVKPSGRPGYETGYEKDLKKQKGEILKFNYLGAIDKLLQPIHIAPVCFFHIF